MKRRALLVGGALGAALLVPSTAAAAIKTAFMGVPPASEKAFRKLNGDVNDFFPHAITVRVGDSVRFVPVGFHTVDLPAKGTSPLPLVAPAGTVSGVNDAAGAPFWFNGQSQLGFNPLLARSAFGKSLTYNGKRRVESGLPLGSKPKPMTVKFLRKGTFTYFCNVHPGMKGVVHVVGPKAKPPSAKADAKAVSREVARDLKELRRVSGFKAPSGTVQVGASGSHGVESFAFYPAMPSVKVGTTVTFRMPLASTEVHTATTGPGDPEKDRSSYLGTLAASFQSPMFDPRASYSSEAPGSTPASLSPTLHGNGFWNSGILDTEKGTPFPTGNSVTFSAPGTYHFYCLIHPFMHAEVNVTS